MKALKAFLKKQMLRLVEPARLLLFYVIEHRTWGRRYLGGHWELWYVDVIHADCWHPVAACSHETGTRPTSICRGTPRCESHPYRHSPFRNWLRGPHFPVPLTAEQGAT